MGLAIRQEIITSARKSFDNIFHGLNSVAPRTFLIPISLVRCCAMNDASPNKRATYQNCNAEKIEAVPNSLFSSKFMSKRDIWVLSLQVTWKVGCAAATGSRPYSMLKKQNLYNMLIGRRTTRRSF
jgi:hypothetical protein